MPVFVSNVLRTYNIQIEAGKDFVVASIKGSSWAEQPRIPAGAPEAGQWAN
jgi:hypothetical protein